MAVPVHATAADLPEVTRVLVAAFAEDPVMRWLFEPAADPDTARGELFDLLVQDYFWLGHLHLVAGPTGVVGAALWAPPDRDVFQGSRVDDLLSRLGPHLGDELLPRLGELGRTHDHRPAEPHLYLGILGVDPACQSSGHGAALLAPTLAECDRMGLLAHLESSNERNIPFYGRHGFEVGDAYRCGDDGALMTMMSRRPRP